VITKTTASEPGSLVEDHYPREDPGDAQIFVTSAIESAAKPGGFTKRDASVPFRRIGGFAGGQLRQGQRSLLFRNFDWKRLIANIRPPTRP